jgi:hypothetical protein
VPHTDLMCCPHVVVPTERAVVLIIVVFAFFLCFPGEVEASNDHAMLQAAACCPWFSPCEMCSEKWHWDALYFQLFLFHLSASLYQCSMFVVIIQALLSNWEPSKKGVVRPSDGNVLPHPQASEGTRVQALVQYLVPCRCHSPGM